MPPSSDIITIDNISKRYQLGRSASGTLRERIVEWVERPRHSREPEIRSIWALRDVSFGVKQGEIVGIVGRNGAGKSTLLKILSRITYPTAGNVRVRGRVASLLEVGVGFHNELTGRENVYLNGSILGMRKKEIDQRFDAIIDFAGVAQFVDTQVKHYSSGMRLRLGFAVAAHLEPDVLIVDEVLAVGDADFQKKCLDAIEGLRGGGRTVLFVSHNMAAVENLCSRGVWIDSGRVRMDGSAQEIVRCYMEAMVGKDSTENTESINLENAFGDGSIQLTRLEYLTKNNLPCRLVRCGEPLTIRIHYQVARTVSNPSFGLRIYTGLGTLVAESGNILYGAIIPVVDPGSYYMDIVLNNLNLLPSRYSLSLWITDSRGEQIYHGDVRTVLEIEPANVYPSGRLPDNRGGIVFFSQQWTPPVSTN